MQLETYIDNSEVYGQIGTSLLVKPGVIKSEKILRHSLTSKLNPPQLWK